ncbi:hypothetical protein [Bradyrhizobium cenepequi]
MPFSKVTTTNILTLIQINARRNRIRTGWIRRRGNRQGYCLVAARIFRHPELAKAGLRLPRQYTVANKQEVPGAAP